MLRGPMKINLEKIKEKLKNASILKMIGEVKKVIGLTIEVRGITASIGEICSVRVPGGREVFAEVVGFREDTSLLMPLGELKGISPGCDVITCGSSFSLNVGPALLGRVLDGLGQPMEELNLDKSQLERYSVDNEPLNPLHRRRINSVLPTGVRALDMLLTCGMGQRIGIFAGSGVGKSTLLGMIARSSSADVNVIGLIGERGREVLDFLEKDLGPQGLARSVVVTATSDQPALVRLKGAYVASSIAEYFRDQGKNVMLLMDSLTRFATAQREVGLAIGEPPATKGYTPSVFAVLPKLLERSGMGPRGSITAFYTVLVEGDDMNDPIADNVRGILDGHIVLSRELAFRNHFPSIDILGSVSRLMAEITPREHQALASRLRDILATYRQAEDLINIGAYKAGTNPKIDEAIKYYPGIIKFLQQAPGELCPYNDSLENLSQVLGGTVKSE